MTTRGGDRQAIREAKRSCKGDTDTAELWAEWLRLIRAGLSHLAGATPGLDNARWWIDESAKISTRSLIMLGAD